MNDKPRLGIVYVPDSVPLLELRATLAPLCHITWIVRPGDQRIADDLPLLRRIGNVTELAASDSAAPSLPPGTIDGITAFDDQALTTTAQIAAELGLVANSPETAELLLNKFKQRKALSAAGLPVPDFHYVAAGELAGELPATLRFPAVVKPNIGNGGRYTHRALTRDLLPTTIQAIRAAGFVGDLIIESELVGPPRSPFGDYVSAECVVHNGTLEVISVTGRMPLVEPFRETGAFIPAAVTPADESMIAETAAAAGRALGVVTGCLHIEIKLTGRGPQIIEVNGRIGGGGIPTLVSDVSGLSLFEVAARTALGLPLPDLKTPRQGVVSYQLALQPPLGIETSLTEDAVSTLRSIESVRRVSIRTRSTTAHTAAGSYNYLLTMYGVANDHAEVVAAYERMQSVMRSA